MARPSKNNISTLRSRLKAIKTVFGSATRAHYIEKLKSFPEVHLTKKEKGIASIELSKNSLLTEEQLFKKLLDVIPTTSSIISNYSREKLEDVLSDDKLTLLDDGSKIIRTELRQTQIKAIETFYQDKIDYDELIAELYEHIGDRGSSERAEIERDIISGRDPDAKRLFDFIEHPGQKLTDADLAVNAKEIKDYIKKVKSKLKIDALNSTETIF